MATLAFVRYALLALVLGAAATHAYPRYKWELPAFPEEFPGVGHQVAVGGGPRNAFGQDFAAAGHKWSVELCMMDSDGDGFSNGEELGDPKCTWTKGMPPPARLASGSISHPGMATSVPQV